MFYGDHLSNRQARQRSQDRIEDLERQAAEAAFAAGWPFDMGRGCYRYPTPADPIDDLAPPAGWPVIEGTPVGQFCARGWWRFNGRWVPMGWHSAEATRWHDAREACLRDAQAMVDVLERAVEG